MPYSKEAEYTHNRQLPPEYFDEKTFKTVPLSHTAYKGKKFDKEGSKAVVGKLKSTGKWDIQSILVPKKEMARGGEVHGGEYQLMRSASGGTWQVKDWDGVVVHTSGSKSDAIEWIEKNKYKKGGKVNFDFIPDTKDLPGYFNFYEAKSKIEELNKQNYKGFSDWRMPTKEELNELYLHKDKIGGFATNYYWSSPEYDADYAWKQDFGNGNQYLYNKNHGFCVRCVRDGKLSKGGSIPDLTKPQKGHWLYNSLDWLMDMTKF